MLDLGAGLPGIVPLCQVAVVEVDTVVVLVVLVVFVEVVKVVEVEVLVLPRWQSVCQGAEQWAAGKDGDRKFDKVRFIIIIYYYYYYLSLLFFDKVLIKYAVHHFDRDRLQKTFEGIRFLELEIGIYKLNLSCLTDKGWLRLGSC